MGYGQTARVRVPSDRSLLSRRVLGGDGIPGKYDYGAKIGLELFDLDADPGELHDVASSQPEVLAELQDRADAQRRRLGDALRGVQGSDNRAPGTARIGKK